MEVGDSSSPGPTCPGRGQLAGDRGQRKGMGGLKSQPGAPVIISSLFCFYAARCAGDNSSLLCFCAARLLQGLAPGHDQLHGLPTTVVIRLQPVGETDTSRRRGPGPATELDRIEALSGVA